MKTIKHILLAVLFITTGIAANAQTMTITFKSGSTQTFDVTNIEKMTWEESNPDPFSLTTPYITWGAKVSAVESYMSTYLRIDGGSSGSATYNSTGGYYYTTFLNYLGSSCDEAIHYYFSSISSGLNESAVLYDATTYDATTVENAVKAKYKDSGKIISGTEIKLYVTNDGKTYIYVTSSSSYTIVDYSDVSIWSSSAKPNSLTLKDANMAKISKDFTLKK